MKILYCNPIALDYRIPFYKQLNKLCDGEFYFLFSSNRYKLTGREKLMQRFIDALGSNAIIYKKEKIFNTYTLSFSKYNSEKGQRIPFPFGLLSTVHSIKPDIIITEGFFQWTPFLILYSQVFKIPLFMGYERTLHTERNTNWMKKLYRKLTNKFITGYLVNGKETQKYLYSLGINEKKIKIGGMSADSKGLITAINNLSVKDKYNFKLKYERGDNGIIYLFIGQIINRKGVRPLLEAWLTHIKQYPNDSLILVGTGNLLEELKDRYKNEHSIFLEGKIEYTHIYKYYAIADVFILPTMEDNWSLVIPEAMACGLPVATTIYNGCHNELIQEGINGHVFDSQISQSIIETLDYFHHVDLKTFGQNSVTIESKFNTENSAKREYQGILEIINTQKTNK